ncbi:hypothetical protein [Helicobacter turcicus]|uniref:Chemotaxis protein n=1 Tax=Helicobacter turcicus TaxID=2867412 RepID=A0ABS7JL57_9HELI|nr:hypothetical protein [Helicobacter turcicus]MBX7490137.1 hypothetical protein [Helicobacter turcicus]MBX7544995.1 hypothetical protein [Helicobacter turcicus]
MGIFQSKKFILLEILLCVILGVGIVCYTQSNQEIIQKQNTAFYYVNISGKQRALAQRIVFLSQIISTNYILKRNNQNVFLELRYCINELSSIHQILQNFVVSTIVGREGHSTLNDVYFGSGGLMFKIEKFLENANKMFYLTNFKDVLQVNQTLLQQLEGDDGLLTSLELATLSQQIYGQTFLREQERNIEWLLYLGLLICGVQVILLLWNVVRR